MVEFYHPNRSLQEGIRGQFCHSQCIETIMAQNTDAWVMQAPRMEVRRSTLVPREGPALTSAPRGRSARK
jgi:hypothetical protein